MKTQLIDRPFEQFNDIFLQILSHGANISLPDFLSIGRDPFNSLVIKDAYASSRHCRIEKCDQKYILRDLRSRNGTYLNGSPVQEATLQSGDIISIGQTDLKVVSKAISYPKTCLSSHNQEWNQQLLTLPSIAQSNFPVLLQGPTGSGKEVLANELHKLSNRKEQQMITINCSALTSSLFESQVFGHLVGSFTGATQDRKGAFAEAHQSTLFLDEIGDLPLEMQPKLLRALENSEITPVGSDKAIKVDVRIIAATHKDLNKMVNEGKFREDLLYRLQTFTIRPPALHERPEDLEALIFSLAKDLRVRFSYNCIQELKAKRWPGNIRQLKQSIQRASVLFKGQTILPQHIPQIVNEEQSKPISNLDILTEHSNKTTKTGVLIKSFEKDLILKRLAANNGNQRRTARELGMAKSTLNDKIRSYKRELQTQQSTR